MDSRGTSKASRHLGDDSAPCAHWAALPAVPRWPAERPSLPLLQFSLIVDVLVSWQNAAGWLRWGPLSSRGPIRPTTSDRARMSGSCHPVFLALVNPKSGGNVGSQLLERFRHILPPERVFNLSEDGGPGPALLSNTNCDNLRLIGKILIMSHWTLLTIQSWFGSLWRRWYRRLDFVRYGHNELSTRPAGHRDHPPWYRKRHVPISQLGWQVPRQAPP